MLFVLLFLLPAITFLSISGEMGIRQCTACICEAASTCALSLSNVKLNTPCKTIGCGPFYITRPYWVDAGSPTIHSPKTKDSLAYDNCVQDVFCAAKTVHDYMRNATIDCNQDGKIDCDDYVLLHKFGAGNCRGDLKNIGDYGKRYLHCKYLVTGLGPGEENEMGSCTQVQCQPDIDIRLSD